MENKKCIKPIEPVVEPEPTIKPVQLKNRFLKHWFMLDLHFLFNHDIRVSLYVQVNSQKVMNFINVQLIWIEGVWISFLKVFIKLLTSQKANKSKILFDNIKSTF